MFGVVSETSYDLHFSVSRIPVRVSVWFWVGGAILGFDTLKLGVQYLLAWLLVLLVSILVHELGHAWTARWFGYSPSILLYQFGGLAFYQPWGRHSRTRSVLISLAGPGAGFVLYGLTELFIHFVVPRFYFNMAPTFRPLLGFILGEMEYVNLYWGLVNLLPVLPLDGGRVTEQVCGYFSPFRGLLYTAWIGAIVGGLVALSFFKEENQYAGFLFLMLAFSNVNIIQQWRYR